MLPRIGSALSKFIPPISSSQSQGQKAVAERSSPEQSHHKSTKKDEHQTPKKPSPSSAKLVTVQSTTTQAEGGTAGAAISVASAFLQIVNFLQIKRGSLVSWLGVQAYGVATRLQKKGAKFRKGTMYDEKAE